MDDKYVRENDPDMVRTDEDLRSDTEPATSHDVVEGGAIGVVGGAIVGGLAGGPLGAIVGAVAGGVASAAGVAAVDRHDHDYARTANSDADGANAPVTSQSAYAEPVNSPGVYDAPPVSTQGAYSGQPVAPQGVYADPAVPSASSVYADTNLNNPELSGTVSGGGPAAYDDYAGDYRNHFQSVYGASGALYDEYDPAYRYGSYLADNSPYHTGEWDSVERFARPDWESRHEGTWDKFKDSVRYGWERAGEKIRGRRSAGAYDASGEPYRHDTMDADEVDVDETRPSSIG